MQNFSAPRFFTKRDSIFLFQNTMQKNAEKCIHFVKQFSAAKYEVKIKYNFWKIAEK